MKARVTVQDDRTLQGIALYEGDEMRVRVVDGKAQVAVKRADAEEAIARMEEAGRAWLANPLRPANRIDWTPQEAAEWAGPAGAPRSAGAT